MWKMTTISPYGTSQCLKDISVMGKVKIPILSACVQYILCWFTKKLQQHITSVLSTWQNHTELIRCWRTTPTAAGQQIIFTIKSYNFPLPVEGWQKFCWTEHKSRCGEQRKCFCSCQTCVSSTFSVICFVPFNVCLMPRLLLTLHYNFCQWNHCHSPEPFKSNQD